MATYKPVLQNYKRKDGLSLIQIRITKDRRITYLPTGYYVKASEWNEKKGEVRSTNSLFGVYNQSVIQKIELLRKIELELDLSGSDPTAEDIQNEFTGKYTSDLSAYYEQYLAEVGAKKSRGTKERLSYSLIKLNDFLTERRKGLKIRQLTLPIIEEFQVWLLAIPNKQSTVNKEIETLKGAIERAVKKGLIPYQKNPFHDFKYTPIQEKEKDILTIEEIVQYMEVDLAPAMNDHRNVFITQFLGAGMRVGDAIALLKTDIKEDRLEYTMQKTGKRRSVPIPDRLMKILKSYNTEGPYIFPFIKPGKDFRNQIESTTAAINASLGRITKKLKINKHVTTHTARHTFSNIALDKTDNLVKIQDALGHSDIRTTMEYIQKMKKGQNDELIKKVTNV